MSQQDSLHVLRRYFVTSAVDQFLQAAGDEEEAILVQTSEVSCAKPAIAKCGLIGFRIIQVAGSNRWSAHNNFAFQFGRQNISGRICNRQFETAGSADRSGFAVLA